MMAAGEPGFDDLTAKARLRDDALKLFVERGIEATSVRDIARAAGVSAGLIRHHFGSKEQLRAACDAYALQQVVQLKEQAVLGGRLSDVGFMSSIHPRMLVFRQYFARSLLDGSPTADAMLQKMMSVSADWLEEHNKDQASDPLAFAALIVSMEIGTLVMRQQLSRVLGADIVEPEGQVRLARAKVELYSKPLLAPDVAAAALATIDQLEERAKPARGTREEASSTNPSQHTEPRRRRVRTPTIGDRPPATGRPATGRPQ